MVKTKEKVTFDVYNVLAQGDSLIAFDSNSSNPVYFHKSKIEKVVVKRRIKGAVQGLLFGGLAGGGFGYAISAGSGWEALVVMVIGGAGGLIGTIPGSIIAAKDLYLLEYDTLAINQADSFPYTTLEASSENLRMQLDANQTESGPSLSQMALAQMPEQPSAPKNQIAGSFFTRSKNNPVNWVAGYSYRRFFSGDSIFSPKFNRFGEYYFNYSYKYVTGHEEGGATNYYMDASLKLLTLGVEGFKRGDRRYGTAGFCELGVSFGYINKSYAQGRDTSHDGLGLIGVIGFRGWSNLLFAEAQVSYGALTGRFIPCVVAGYRFQ